MTRVGKQLGMRWPEHAQMFTQFFAGFEHALKRAGYARNIDRAEADWSRFSRDLGPAFLESVRASGAAATMIAEPPRRMMRDTFEWVPRHPAPIADVTELFVRGVCQVRNNLVHGEKRFLAGAEGPQRADILVLEATAILEQALEVMPELKKHFEGVAP